MAFSSRQTARKKAKQTAVISISLGNNFCQILNKVVGLSNICNKTENFSFQLGKTNWKMEIPRSLNISQPYENVKMLLQFCPKNTQVGNIW